MRMCAVELANMFKVSFMGLRMYTVELANMFEVRE